MSHGNRVFITGRSALTASGLTADETWDAVCSGKSGIEEITQWDLSSWSHRLAGELKGFEAAKMLPDRKLMKVISRQDAMGINAAMQAVTNAQIIPYRDSLTDPSEYNDQTGVYVGSPGNKYVQQYEFLPLLAKTQGNMQDFGHQLFDEVHPMWLLRILPNNVLAYTGITYQFKGPNHNITNHAVSGAQAILEAYNAIRSGQIERAVVVAYDLAVEPQALFYYKELGVISEHHLKPFDSAHDGTILADGAAALVLESEHSVKARDARCYGEIVSGFAASEASGLFSLESTGAHLSELMERTVHAAGLSPKDIGMIVAHGNGNIKSDDSEAQAMRTVFGGEQIPTTAFKWSMGHTICASAVIDAVLTTYALEHQSVPGVANLESLAPSCHDLCLSATHQAIAPGAYALVINRGYASMNACFAIKSCGKTWGC